MTSVVVLLRAPPGAARDIVRRVVWQENTVPERGKRLMGKSSLTGNHSKQQQVVGGFSGKNPKK